MAEQLVLLELDERPKARAARARRRAAQEWRLDEHTVAIGRQGLEHARRALRRSRPTAA